MKEYGLSQRDACRLARINPATFQYQPPPQSNAEVGQQWRDLAKKHPRWVLAKKHSWWVLAKPIRRWGARAGSSTTSASRLCGAKSVCWLAALLAPSASRRAGRLRFRSRPRLPNRSGPSPASPTGLVYDFIFEATQSGTRLKMLRVGADFTPECLAIEVATWLPWTKGSAVVTWLVAKQGAPPYLRSDNAPEFIASALQSCLASQQRRRD